MTLKEKFRDKILSFLSDNMKEQNAIECEQIADEYAIGFAAWCIWNEVEDVSTYSFKELLELYKIEQGL